MSDLEDDLEEFDAEDNFDAEEVGLEEPEEELSELSELSKEFVKILVDKIMQFMVLLVGHELHPYQQPLARRIIESIIIY